MMKWCWHHTFLTQEAIPSDHGWLPPSPSLGGMVLTGTCSSPTLLSNFSRDVNTGSQNFFESAITQVTKPSLFWFYNKLVSATFTPESSTWRLSRGVAARNFLGWVPSCPPVDVVLFCVYFNMHHCIGTNLEIATSKRVLQKWKYAPLFSQIAIIKWS